MALSNITVTVTEPNVSVTNNTTNVSVAQTLSNIVVGTATGVAQSEIRSALSNVSPILYDTSNGIFSFDNTAITNDTVVDNGNLNGDITLNLNTGRLHKVQLTGNITGITLTGLTSGAAATIVFTQDGSGGHALDTTTTASNWTAWEFANDFKAFDANPLNWTAMNLFYDGTKIFASLVTDSAGNITNAELENSNVVINGITIDLGSSANITAPMDLTALSVTTSSPSGNGSLSYNNTSGVFTFAPADTSAAGIALTDLSVTQASASGTGTLAYNNSSGVFTYTPPVLSSFIDLTDLSVTQASASGTGTLAYNNVTGVTTYTPPDLSTFGTSNLTNAQVISHISTVPLTVGGNLSVTGNIDATGNINYQNVTDLFVTDQKITLNANATTDASVDVIANRPQNTYSGILRWNETSDKWTFMNGDNVFHDLLTTTQSKALVSATDSGGLGSFTYDNGTGVFEYTGPADSDVRGLFSASDAGGLGSFAYNSGNGDFTYTGPANSDITGLFSANDTGGLGSLSYSGGIYTYTGPADSDVRGLVSVTQASASGSGALAYDSGTGVFTYTPPDLTSFGLSNAQAQAYIQSNGLAMTSNLTSNSLISTTGNVQINSATPVDGITGFTFDATTNGIGLGTVTPTAQIHVVRDTTSASTPPSILLGEYSDSSTNGNRLQFKRSNGSTASPTVIGNNDLVSVTSYEAYDGSAYINQFEEFVYHDNSINTPSTGNVALTKEFVVTLDNDNFKNPVLTLMGNGTIRFNKSSQKNFGSGSAPYGTANLDINGNFVTAGTITATGNITGTSNIAAGNISATTNVEAAIVSASSRADAPKLYGGNTTVDLSQIIGTTNGGGLNYIQFSSANDPDFPDGAKILIQDSSATNPFANGSIKSDNVFFTRKFSGGGGYYLLYTDEACQSLVGASTSDINPTTANVTYAMLQARDAITLGPDSAARSSNVYLQKARIRYDVDIGEVNLRNSKVDISGDTTMTNYSGNAALTLVNNRNDSGVPTQVVMKQNKAVGTVAGVAGDQLSVLNTQGMTTNTGSGLKTYANVLAKITDPTDSAEHGEIDFRLIKAGTETSTMLLKSTEMDLNVPLNSNSNITTTGSFNGDGSGLTNVPSISFGHVTVSGQTNIQASQANAVLDIASTGDITLSTSGNTLTIGGSGAGYGNAEVTTYLASGTSTGNVAFTGNLIVESGNTSLTVDNYYGSGNTGSIDQIFFNSDPGLFSGQPITFSGTINSDLVFLNGNTYYVQHAGGGYYRLYTDAGTLTGLISGLGQENPQSLVGAVRNPTNCEALVQGNVKVGQGGTLHADAFKPTTSGGTISFSGVRMSDVGLGSNGANFFWPETGGNTEGALLTAHSDNVGTWENTIDIEYDDVSGPEALKYTNYRTSSLPIETMFKKANGTKASPAAVSGTSASGGGDRIWEQEYYGHDGTDFQVTMGEHVYVDQASNPVSTGVVPLAKEIYVRYNGDTSVSPIQSIVKYRANKHIEFNAPTGTRGYGTQGNANIQMDGSIYSGQTVNALNVSARQLVQLKNYTTTEINALSGMVAGDTVFNTTLALICFYNGVAWRRVNDATM